MTETRYPFSGHGRRPDGLGVDMYTRIREALDKGEETVELPPVDWIERTAYRMRVRRAAELCGAHAASVSFLSGGGAVVTLERR